MALTTNAYSVVIPAFNAEATLADAISSVLKQSQSPAEVIVVDDGSTDDTANVARGFRPHVRYLYQSNAGPGAATTLGLTAVTTRIAATLDADDLWLPSKAERQLRHLEENPVAATFSLLRQFSDNPNDVRAGSVTKGWSRSTMLLKMTLFAAVGPIRDPPGRRGELVDWIARCRETGAQLTMLDEVLALRRIRPGSLSDGRTPSRDRGYLHAARAAIERRRAARAEN
jgi:glycosyltransferase involved in cell wall biosynthesis